MSAAPTKLSPLAFNVPIVYPKTGYPTPYFSQMLQRWLTEKKITDDLAADAVPGTRQVIAGAGLTGGGDLTADRTLDVGAGTGITVGANSVSIDVSAEAERIRDVIGTALVAGSNISITVNDPGDTITIASSATYTDEQVRDVIGSALVAGANTTITVNDPGDTITIASTGYTDEQVRDVIGAALVAGSNVTITVNDPGDTITIAATGGSGGAWTQISSQTVTGSAVATVSFTSIPGTYKDLILVSRPRGTAAVAAVNLQMQFNSDTGANYDWGTISAASATVTYGTSVGANSIRVGAISAGTSINANRYGSVTVEIVQYTNISMEKDIISRSWDDASRTTGTFRRQDGGGTWRNTAAITRIDLAMDSGNIDVGSTFVLYGRT
jgi:hypothetical protein